MWYGMAAVMKMLRVTGRLARLSPRGEDGVVGAEEASSSAACLAASALRGGCLVALPTDTVYSMACLAENSRALEALYRLKGRDPGKLLAICLPNLDLLHRFCKVHVPEGLLQDLLPGPVTLVLERSKALNPDLNTYTPLVGVRIPNHWFVQELARICAAPLALTTANPSHRGSTLNITVGSTGAPHIGGRECVWGEGRKHSGGQDTNRGRPPLSLPIHMLLARLLAHLVTELLIISLCNKILNIFCSYLVLEFNATLPKSHVLDEEWFS